MQTVGIRDLQINPAIFTKSLENNEFVMITKRGKPLGVATSFEDDILRQGFLESLVLMAFERGNISLSQLSKSLKLTKTETMKLLATLDIPVTNYKLEEDLKGIESFLK
jgi:predicted HTH domain antitoxin